MKKFIICLILQITTLACITNYSFNTIISSQNDSPILSTLQNKTTQTKTPFQPIPPTSTQTLTPTPLDTNTPTVTPTYFTPTPTLWNHNLIPPEEQINVLVLGSDWRPGAGFRTDVILFISINPKEKIVSAVSFPRDLYVTIPGHGQNRINVAQALGGINLMSDTLYENFYIRPDYYIMTNMQGFVGIINNLGGIDINASNQLSDKCDLPQAYQGYCTMGPGTIHMDGDTALWYARSRYTTSDFDRMRRSQEIMLAILQKMISINVVLRAPDLYNLVINNVETNLPMNTILSLVLITPNITTRQYIIGSSETTPYRVPENGAQVLLPDDFAIQKILRHAIYLY